MSLKSAEVLRLQTLGALVVTDERGESVRAIAGQRRLLAFLSIVAAGGRAGVSRDRVAALLWPESTAERAGQSITQALYSTRRALEAEDLFLTSGDLRLNPERITNDVQEFETAIAQEDWAVAAAVYGGTFLDGFFLSGLAEFERWTSAQRMRYEEAYVRALRRLAERAEQDGDVSGALHAWNRLAAARPLDASVAVSLMNAMARAGNRAGAIQHAAIYSTLLREELELDPDPVVSATADRLRQPSPWAMPSATPLAGDGSIATVESTATSLVEQVQNLDAASQAEQLHPASQAAHTSALSARVARRPTARLARLSLLSVGLALTALAGWYVTTARHRATSLPEQLVAALPERVVVAPFRVNGASASLSYLREGVVELLSERLADDSASRAVDAGTVLSVWRRATAGSATDLSRDSVVRLASTLGAQRVIVGSVVGTPDHVILSANIIDAATGRTGGAATAEGAADSVSHLVDQLAAGLLVQQAGESKVIGSHATRSLAALRDFLAGQAAFRRGAYDAALRAYSGALERDSSFALAALQMVRAGDRLQAITTRDEPIDLAWRARPNLSTRDQALLDALASPRYPRPATDAEQLAAWQRLVALTPDRAGAWYELGARLFHSGAVIGMADARKRSADALKRALSIDASYAPARRLLAHLAASDSTAGIAVLSAATIRDSAGPLAPSELWRAAVARGDDGTLAALRDTLARLGPANLRVIAQMSQFDAVGLGDARRALDILRSRPARPSERLEQAEAQHSLAMIQGRVGDLRAARDRLRNLVPGTHASLRLQVLDALYGDGDVGEAVEAMRQMAAEEVEDVPAASHDAVRLADVCVAGQWRAAHGDLAGAKRDLTLLQSDAGVGDAAHEGSIASLVAATPPSVCIALLDASLVVARGGAPARDALAGLDSLALIPPVAADASTYAPIMIARLHASTGDVAGALAAVRRRVYLMGWPRYLATALREESQYAELLGDAARERSALERFLRLRSNADRALTVEIHAARQRLRALGTGSSL